MIYSPDIPLRTAYISAIKIATGLEVYPDNVPKSVTVPTQYILITSQTNVRTAVAKPTFTLSDNYDWLSNIVFDIQYFSPSGYSNPGAVDIIYEQIINVAENILVPGWAVKSRIFVQSRPLNISTATNYINRKVLTYSHWLQKL
jgi:hypothetical protein